MLQVLTELLNNICSNTFFYVLLRLFNPLTLIERYYKVKKLKIEAKIEEEKLKNIIKTNKE